MWGNMVGAPCGFVLLASRRHIQCPCCSNTKGMSHAAPLCAAVPGHQGAPTRRDGAPGGAPAGAALPRGACGREQSVAAAPAAVGLLWRGVLLVLLEAGAGQVQHDYGTWPVCEAWAMHFLLLHPPIPPPAGAGRAGGGVGRGVGGAAEIRRDCDRASGCAGWPLSLQRLGLAVCLGWAQLGGLWCRPWQLISCCRHCCCRPPLPRRCGRRRAAAAVPPL